MAHRTDIAKVLLASLAILAVAVPMALARTIDDANKYAWGENIGWLNWGTDEGDVDVLADSVDGYVWGENVGWISLSCANTSSCGSVDYEVTRNGSDLAGYAWGENIGWVSFSCENTSSCGSVDYGVTIDNDGFLSGYAWGENVGWVSLNCSNTGTCGTVDYSVQTSPTPNPGGGGVVPSGGPTPTVGPGIIVTKVPSTTSPAPGGTITYSVTVSSVGTTAAEGVVISDTIDADTTLVSASPSADFSGGGTFGYNRGTMAPGASFSYQSQVRVRGDAPDGTPIINTVTVNGTNFATVTATSAAVVRTSGGGAATPTPSATTTPTAGPPTPSATASPTGTPLPPTPTVTPTATPPFGTPTTPPPTVTPPTPPLERVIDAVSGLLDRLGRLLLGPTLGEWCGGSGVQSVACASTAMAVIAGLLGLLAGLAQKEAVAAAYSLMQVFGLRKKARVWGVVYDSTTKHPVPLAKVELLDEYGRVLETRFADRDGRYGFLTSPASLNQDELTVSLRVSKPGYRFPSTAVSADVDYIVYDRLYRGGTITMRRDAVVNFNVPVDPQSQTRPSMSGFGSGLIGTLGDKLLSFGFYVGLVAVPVSYYLQPTTKNLILLVAFFAANLFRLFVVYRPYGITVDAATGKPLSYALVTLLDEAGNRVAFAVSDEHGRFILSGPKDMALDIAAYTPANVSPQRTTKVRLPARRRGWVTSRIRI